MVLFWKVPSRGIPTQSAPLEYSWSASYSPTQLNLHVGRVLGLVLKHSSYRLSLTFSSWNLAEESGMDGLAPRGPGSSPGSSHQMKRGAVVRAQVLELGRFGMNPMLDA